MSNNTQIQSRLFSVDITFILISALIYSLLVLPKGVLLNTYLIKLQLHQFFSVLIFSFLIFSSIIKGHFLFRKMFYGIYFIIYYLSLFLVNFSIEASNLVFQVFVLFVSGLIIGSYIKNIERLIKLETVLFTVFVILSVVIIYEYFTQTKVFYNRSYYFESTDAFSINLGKISFDFTTLKSSIGPFGSNLQLAGPYLLLGFLIILRSESLLSRMIFVFLFSLSVIGIQSRAGIISMLFFYGIWFNYINFKERIIAFFMILIAGICSFLYFGYSTVMASIFYFPIPLYLFFALLVMTIIVGYFFIRFLFTKKLLLIALLSSLLVLFFLDFGDDDATSLDGRLFGFKLLFENLLHNPMGAGPGNYTLGLVDSFDVFSDQGSILILLIETGIIGIFLLTCFFFKVFSLGYSPKNISGFYVLSLIGIIPYIIFTISFDVWFLIVLYSVVALRLQSVKRNTSV